MLVKMLNKLRSAVLGLLLCSSSYMQAGQVDLLAGAYAIDAKTSAGEVSLKKVGLTKFNYYLDMGPKLALRPGYSLYIMTGKETDIGYGFDLSFIYYPLTRVPSFNLNYGSIRWKHKEVFKPYVGFSFHQRQYQSIQSNYAGLGVNAGIEYRPSFLLPDEMHVVAEVNVLALDGPLAATITETQASIGLGSSF